MANYKLNDILVIFGKFGVEEEKMFRFIGSKAKDVAGRRALQLESHGAQPLLSEGNSLQESPHCQRARQASSLCITDL